MNRHAGGLDDLTLAAKGPQPTAIARKTPRVAQAVGVAALLLFRTLLLDASEQAGHTRQTGADDARVELDEGPQRQVGVVVGRVGRGGPAGEEGEAYDRADGYEETQEEGQDHTTFGLPVGFEFQSVKDIIVSELFPGTVPRYG